MAKYIDAEAAVETFRLWFERIGTKPSFDDVQAIIPQVPAADVALVRHGRWEVLEHYRDGDTAERCSQCRALIFFRCKTPKNYCPHCGAKMDGEVGDNAKN